MLEDGWRFTPATMAHKITRGRWIPAKHLLYISSIITHAIAQGGARVILTMPPRHGKSEFLSVNTPIWHMETWPEKQVMGISYGLDLITEFSPRVRNAFTDEDNHHLLNTRLSRDKMRVDRFKTTAGGGYAAAGIGGVITGRGAHLMLIDDYIKNAEDSLSKTQREKTWQWFKSTAWTRLEPGGSIVILATRWNQDDLIARCLTELAHENWIVINLPAIAMENDPLGREVGEALWADRYPLEELLKIKETLGTYWWMALYQQDPMASMAGMDLGERLIVIPESKLPHHTLLKRVRSWDMAASGPNMGGDWTVGTLLGVRKDDPGKCFILDVQRFQKTPSDTEIMVRAVAEGDGAGVKIWMEQEPGSAGKTVIEHYETKILRGFAFTGERATGPVEVRAQPALAGIEAGNVIAVEGSYIPDLRVELNAFPDGDFDDQVVSISLGHNKLVRTKYKGITWGTKRDSNKAVRDQRHRAIMGIRKRLTW